MINLPDPKTILVSLYGRHVGRLALTPDGVCAFQYDASFARDGYSVSPLKLPLGPELFLAKPLPFDGGFGVFDDSLPDGWGRLVQDRFLRGNGIDPENLTVLQRLLLVGSDARGALSYASGDDAQGSGKEVQFLPPVPFFVPFTGAEISVLAEQAVKLFAGTDQASEQGLNI